MRAVRAILSDRCKFTLTGNTHLLTGTYPSFYRSSIVPTIPTLHETRIRVGGLSFGQLSLDVFMLPDFGPGKGFLVFRAEVWGGSPQFALHASLIRSCVPTMDITVIEGSSPFYRSYTPMLNHLQEEPLLVVNPHRFVLHPIKYPDVSCYSKFIVGVNLRWNYILSFGSSTSRLSPHFGRYPRLI